MIGGNEFNECKKDKKGIEVKDLGSAKGYMLCWNDGSDDVGLVEWPDYSRKSDKYSSTALAYWTHVREMTEVQLTAYLFLASMHLIVRDRFPIKSNKEIRGTHRITTGCCFRCTSGRMPPNFYEILHLLKR